MPFSENADLPAEVIAAIPSPEGRTIWRNAFNAILDSGGEEAAFRGAWGALANAGFEKSPDSELWVRKRENDGKYRTIKGYAETFEALGDRDKALATAYSEISNEFGAWGRDDAEFKSVSDVAGVTCDRCALWTGEAQKTCLIVAGDIPGGARCRLWVIPEVAPLPEGAEDPNEPTVHEEEPQIAFVVSRKSAIEAARGEYLVSADGAIFRDVYLSALGKKRRDVLVVGLDEFKELEKNPPPVIVALGKEAKSVLGKRVTHTMPHPYAVRRFGDSGEVGRKAKSILRKLAVHTRNDIQSPPRVDETHRVPISKADSEKKIVVGVVLDPYSPDAHGDWIPPDEIENTAHQWMAGSRVIGVEHGETAEAFPVESHLVPYPSQKDYRKALRKEPHRAYKMQLGSDVVHSGAWILATKLSDKLWKRVQSGELGAYSIGGFCRQKPSSVGQMPVVDFVSLKDGDIETKRIDGPGDA